MNKLIQLVTVAALVGAAVAPAAAQTAPSRVTSRAAAVAAPAPSAPVANANPDSLNNWYAIKPLIPQCGDQPVVGPMPAAQTGTVQAAPLYTWLIDPDMVGLACRKPI
ncbi:MAG TPA: hypothetical protein VGX96_02835 [Candidatus Elarobacter sp.]|jgi:hypothetical protein|nr:hypothetical protein [Candidatus Elarobacter sp.]